MIGCEDLEFQIGEDDAMRSAIEMFAYTHDQAEQLTRSPREDLMGAILHGEVDGERISMAEFDAFFSILALAGDATTRNMISRGFLLLLAHPEQKWRVLVEPALIPVAVEEMLRYRPPRMYFWRRVMEDTVLRGVSIRRSDKVALWCPSAKSDEDVSEDPRCVDINRKPKDHLAFGVGEHFCLGAQLARQEVREMFRQLLVRFPDTELAGDVEYLRSHFIDEVQHIPVKCSAP